MLFIVVIILESVNYSLVDLYVLLFTILISFFICQDVVINRWTMGWQLLSILLVSLHSFISWIVLLDSSRLPVSDLYVQSERTYEYSVKGPVWYTSRCIIQSCVKFSLHCMCRSRNWSFDTIFSNQFHFDLLSG